MSLRNIILEKKSPFIVSTNPSLEITLSEGVEVPDTARYFLANLAISGYFLHLFLHHRNGQPSALSFGSSLYLVN